MSVPVTEILSFPASAEYQANQNVLAGVVDILKKAAGQINTYHALQVEDSSKGYAFVVWETYEHHKKVMDAPDYPELINTLKPALGGDPEMIHVKFDKDPTAALSAPVTEIIYLTLKPGKTKEDLAPWVDKLIKQNTPTVLSATWGPTVEREDLVVAVVGWESLEAHAEVMKNPSEVSKSVAGPLMEAAVHSVAHAKLSKY